MDLKPTPTESILFGLRIAASIMMLLTIAGCIIAFAFGSSALDLDTKTTVSIGTFIGVFIFYGLLIALWFFFIKLIMVGHLKGNGVRLDEGQFGDIYARVKTLAAAMGLTRVPPVYVVQSGGVLNAFATRFLTKDYVAVYSDVFTMLDKDPDVLAFVIAHELSHVKRMHMSRRFWTWPSVFIPFLDQAYSRACEYTCDNWAHNLVPHGAKNGLLFLAIGKDLYGRVDADRYIANAKQDADGTVQLSELFSSHPYLPKRITALTSKPFSAF